MRIKTNCALKCFRQTGRKQAAVDAPRRALVVGVTLVIGLACFQNKTFIDLCLEMMLEVCDADKPQYL